MQTSSLLFLVVLALSCLLLPALASSDCEERSLSKVRKHHGHHHKAAAHHAEARAARAKKNHKHHTAHRATKAKKGGKKHKSAHKAEVAGKPAVVSIVSSKIDAVTSACGSANPTSSSTVSGGPNGRQSFLNCGISSGGWNPPMITIGMLKTVTIESASNIYGACAPYTKYFEQYGAEFGIPPIFLAAIAMQESSCRAYTSGDNGGAFGLMQITQDKCNGAPGGDCSNPEFNVRVGASVLKDGLDASGGNVLVALGGYNGWFPKMTTAEATAARNSGCCECQQNLDYLQQFLNGWIVGVDPYSHNLGAIGNLNACGNN